MSRFHIATAVAGACLGAVALLSNGPARIWLVCAVVAVYLALVGLGAAFIRMRFFCDAICRVGRGAKVAALTFDDGPDRNVTPRILDVLREYDAPATFLCIGRRALEHSDIVRRIAAEGHQIGNHTFCHAWWSNFLGGRGLLREITHAQEALKSAANVTPRYFRSPMGLTNPHLRRALAAAGLRLVGWDVRSLDRGSPSKPVVRRVLDRVRPGSIILLHDGGVDPAVAVETLRDIIEGLRKEGYALCMLDGSTRRSAVREAAV